MDEAERRGVQFPRKGAIVRPQKNPIEWRVNVTQMKKPDGSALDGTDADELSAGEIEGRRQVMQFFEFLKREAPGFANSYIVDIPPQLGIRETRRITGPYQLTGDDVLDLRQLSPTPSASTAGRSRRTSPATSNGSGRDIPESRGFNQLPYRMLVPAAEGVRQPAGRRPLRLDDARGPVGGARQRRLLRHGPGRGARAAHLALAGNSALRRYSGRGLARSCLRSDGAYLGRDVPTR